MLFGTTELGRAIYSYNTLDKTVRDAARHLSQHGPGDATIAGRSALPGGARQRRIAPAPALAPGLTTSSVVLLRRASAAPRTHANQPTGLGVDQPRSPSSIQGYAYNSVVEFVIPNLTFNNISVTMRAQL